MCVILSCFKIADGGLKKLIIKKSDGPQIPQKDVRAIVHYVGQLTNGKEFDSSRKRNSPLQFSLNKSQVILGWDKGVSTMRKGEICLLSCSPDYGYGGVGMGSIPPNSTLIFEIELIDWVEDKDSLFSNLMNNLVYTVVVVFLILAYVYYKHFY